MIRPVSTTGGRDALLCQESLWPNGRKEFFFHLTTQEASSHMPICANAESERYRGIQTAALFAEDRIKHQEKVH